MGSSAEHTLYGSCKNTAGAQQDRCTVAFDLENFVFPNPITSANFSPNLVRFCFAKKNTDTMRTIRHGSHAKIAKTINSLQEKAIRYILLELDPHEMGKKMPTACPYSTDFKGGLHI